jgi:hypothetical protein
LFSTIVNKNENNTISRSQKSCYKMRCLSINPP